MPRISNPRHEAFCQAFVQGKTVGNATASYKAAGFKGDRREASKLRHVPDIARRVAELQAQVSDVQTRATEKAVEKRAITVDSLIEELDALKAAAMNLKQAGPAVAALTAKAKLAGLWIERAKHEVTEATVHYIISDEPMTAEEWIEYCGATVLK